MNGIDERGLNYWRLCDELSISETAFLCLGKDPTIEKMRLMEGDSPGYEDTNGCGGYNALITAIITAIRQERISGRLVGYGAGKPAETDSIDTFKSKLDVVSLRSWLQQKGERPDFFFPDNKRDTFIPDYLDKNHPRYAPKLAAAVNAWITVDNQQGKTPKQQLEKWLREHAGEYGLSNDDGDPNEQGITECAKVANWNPGGGAPSTP